VPGALSGFPPKFDYKISLGHNFLFDEEVLRQLVAASGTKKGDRVLEIGAGRGDLTLALLAQGAVVTAVEIDQRLIPVLHERLGDAPDVRIVHGDIMALELEELMGRTLPFHVVANLPYYLTTPILTRLLKADFRILSVNVMVQEEAAARLMAPPGSREYGPLAVLAAYRGRPVAALRVPARLFTPPPKVDSVFVTLPFFKARPRIPKDEGLFFRLVQAGFALRRKTLVNNLVPAFALSRQQAVQLVTSAGLSENIRGERLTLADYITLADVLSEALDGERQ